MDVRKMHRDVGVELCEDDPSQDATLRLLQDVYQRWTPVKGWNQTDVICYVAGLLAEQRGPTHAR
jgi:hypothetical protein